eukprot:TRINITY_DN17293_c0_g1_i1.p2 TRINITY_DN17293_c0_g1~~TRINITY_DN17293_c0_g1_i1.p2  ORF type:complete len:615 (-),score=112.80 TRINITY_DN17293_c0_g1_i1:2370-4214(-)
MADHEEDDLQMALRMSLQPQPEPKRSKPRENSNPNSDGDDSEAAIRIRQRELMLAAAEKRMQEAKQSIMRNISPLTQQHPPQSVTEVREFKRGPDSSQKKSSVDVRGKALSAEEADQLFRVVFGREVSKDILSQWCNQGFRFSSEPDTALGLVQSEGGPCGVLATVQAVVLKYLLFMPDTLNIIHNKSGQQNTSHLGRVTPENFSSITDEVKKRALILAMSETLLLAGRNCQAVVVTVDFQSLHGEGYSDLKQKDDMIIKALEGISLCSPSELQQILRLYSFNTRTSLVSKLEELLPIFQSRMGVLLFLFSALLSRGLDLIQTDRDDAGQPLVTAPFGHASQEIVNLLLCGQAVSNVFDGHMDLGDGMFLKGIPTTVEVGFLTLLESLNFCKVGQYLKRPKWPIWVVGSESHYTVLFAFDVNVQNENELESREAQIRKAFDAHDQSGGGGFISTNALQQILHDLRIEMPHDKLQILFSNEFVVWNEFWQILLQIDQKLGGLKDSSGLMGKKQFDIYHFNGIAKVVMNTAQTAGETQQQRPRLTKLRVTVPPRWTPEEFMAEVSSSQSVDSNTKGDSVESGGRDEPPQHAPLVDCIRTRWPRAVCNWNGDPPSIV